MIRDALTVRPTFTALILGTAALLVGTSVAVMKPAPRRVEYGCSLPADYSARMTAMPLIEQPPTSIRTRLQIDHLSPACQRYVLEIEALSLCETLPKESRDALSQGAGQLAQVWSNISHDAMPELDKACQQAADAIRQASQQLQCAPATY